MASVQPVHEVGWLPSVRSAGPDSQSEPPKWRPFFHLSNIFTQSFGLNESVRGLQQSDSVHRSGIIEDCNFSKMALRYADGLTKDQVSGALRLVIQTIGESMRIRSNTVILEFDVGRMSYGNGYATFSFRKNLKELTGCPGDLDLSTYLTNKTTASTKSTGSRNSRNAHRSSSADSLPSSGVQCQTSTSNSQRSKSVVSTKQDKVFREALDRHLKELEMKAQYAVNAREEWKTLMKASEQQGRNEIIDRRNEARKNLIFLMDQIKTNESKRKAEKKYTVEAASSHTFPNLADEPLKSLNRSQIRQELDQQVHAALSARERVRSEEAALAYKMNENSRKALEEERLRESTLKEKQRKVLSDAWTRDMRLKNCWKAIEGMDIIPR